MRHRLYNILFCNNLLDSSSCIITVICPWNDNRRRTAFKVKLNFRVRGSIPSIVSPNNVAFFFVFCVSSRIFQGLRVPLGYGPERLTGQCTRSNLVSKTNSNRLLFVNIIMLLRRTSRIDVNFITFYSELLSYRWNNANRCSNR